MPRAPATPAPASDPFETRILLPTHLFPASLVPEPASRCVLLEERGYFTGPTGDFRIHLGRLAYARAACDAHAQSTGIRRVSLEDSEAWLREAGSARRRGGEAAQARSFVVWDPLDNAVLARLKRALGARLRVDPVHPGFAIGDPAAEYRGALALKSVFEHCKRAAGILVGVPSTDSENRRPPDAAMRKAVAGADSARERLFASATAPTTTLARKDEVVVARACRWASSAFPDNPGDVRAARLYPHTRERALAALAVFLRRALPSFGPYQDAVLTGGGEGGVRPGRAKGTSAPSAGRRNSVPFGVHSGLAAAMNLGLLLPIECARAAVRELEAGRAPLQSVEAYVRQLLGWREYTRVLYHRHGAELERGPFAKYPRLTDPWYATAASLASPSAPTASSPTAPNSKASPSAPASPFLPLGDAVRRALATAYLDHISRLMIVNNLGILHGAHPGGLLRWFTELVAADAHQWAMVANLAHMGDMEVAEGVSKKKKRLARRAYVSSSAYLRRMTDLPPGDWEDKLDAAFYSYAASGSPGAAYYRAALSGKRYRSDEARWKALAARAKAELAGK
jgi:deoxyribodipyrimidine photolyase-related protein